ncbi:hypothetical protein LMG10661_02269 [Ralstonia syzygii subsp. syzygii]|nr:hypothetical protein LMG10661_02269 [Ralstonia syzygii subsp. syzygii]
MKKIQSESAESASERIDARIEELGWGTGEGRCSAGSAP